MATRWIILASLPVVLGACSEEQSIPDAAGDGPPLLDGGSLETAADLPTAADGADAAVVPDSSLEAAPAPDAASWPAGFTPQPTNVPAGLLCSIPADYIATGGDPVNPPCALEADSFSTADHTVMPSGLKVVTWNVEYGKQSAAIKQAFSTTPDLFDVDVLLLQEVPRLDGESNPPQINLARELAQALKMNYVFGVEWDRRLNSSQGGEHGLAILSRYPLGNAELLRHTPLYSFWAEKKHYGGRATLGADIVVGGQRIRIYNAHLCTRDWTGSGRAKQGAEILADAALASRPPVKLLGGDFNTFLCNPQILTCNKPPAAEQVIQDILNDGWADLLPGFNGWTQLGIGFFPQRLDWLFAKQVTPVSEKVLQSVKASDHVPVTAIFSVP